MDLSFRNSFGTAFRCDLLFASCLCLIFSGPSARCLIAQDQTPINASTDARVVASSPATDSASPDLANPPKSSGDQAAVASAKGLSKAFNLAANKVMPATVKILSRTRKESEEDPILSLIGGDDSMVFDSVGSGVIVSSDGLILTNHHVIRDATRVEVRLQDGRSYRVIDSKSDPKSDVAIIRVEAEDDLPVADLGKAHELYVGEWVLAIGSPFMLESSVSAGIISGTRRFRRLSRTVSGQFLQTDAAINPGNSGGPLINLDGQVIGINTAISSTTGSFQGIGFAIPIERADWIRNELVKFGEVRRSYVGVATSDLSPAGARALGIDTQQGGAMVNNVVPDYPAQKAGLRPGDVIVQFDGQAVESAGEFQEMVQQSSIGEPIPVIVVRDRKRVELEVQLVERPQ